MADTDIVQVIAEARVDARSLSEFVFKPANFIVSRRLAPSINTLQYYIDRANSVNNAFSKSVSDATAAANIAISAANTANQNAIGLIDSVTNQASQSVQNAIRDVAIDANLVTDALTTIVPITTSATARTQLDKNRESISVFDFFTHAELAEYKQNAHLITSLFDAYRPLQEFFDYTAANNVGTAYCNGNFSTTQGIIMGGSTGRSLTKLIIGDFRLVAINDINNIIDDLLQISMGETFTWTGTIEVLGSGPLALDYDKRKVRNGIRFGGIRGTNLASTHNNFGTIDVSNGFLHWGVILDNLTTGTIINKLRVNRSGCGFNDINSTRVTSLFSDFTVVSHKEGTGNQSTTLKLSNPQDFSKLDGVCYVEINQQLYYAYSINVTTENPDELTVFPKLPSGVTAGNLKFIFGGGFLTRGGDSSVPSINAASITTSSIALSLESLYPPVFGAIITQANCIVLSIGSGLDSGVVGGYASEIYFEDQNYSIVQNTRYRHNFKIGNTVNFKIDKAICIANHRLADDTMASAWNYSGQIGIRNNTVTPISHFITHIRTIDLGDYQSSPVTHIASISSNKTITLELGTTTSVRSLMLFGQVTKTVYAYTSIGGKQNITVIPPADVEVNGSTSPISLDNYIGVVRLDFHLYSSTQVVMQVSGNKEEVMP